MKQTLDLTASDGYVVNAYVAKPSGAARGGLVVIQEIFGVNSHIRAIADGYAADGYLAIAPSLFDRVERTADGQGIELGYASTDIERGKAVRNAAGNEKPLLDIAAAIAHVKSAGKVGVIGYCWGGLLSWLAACNLQGIAAAVPYYGGGMPDHAHLVPRCPVMAHFGERDANIPLPTIEAFRAAQPALTVHLYPAGHGFNCDQRGSYDAGAAKLARERTLAFLREHVG